MALAIEEMGRGGNKSRAATCKAHVRKYTQMLRLEDKKGWSVSVCSPRSLKPCARSRSDHDVTCRYRLKVSHACFFGPILMLTALVCVLDSNLFRKMLSAPASASASSGMSANANPFAPGVEYSEEGVAVSGPGRARTPACRPGYRRTVKAATVVAAAAADNTALSSGNDVECRVCGQAWPGLW